MNVYTLVSEKSGGSIFYIVKLSENCEDDWNIYFLKK